MSKVVLRGANELLWPRGFQIGVTLDALCVVGCFRFFLFSSSCFLHFSIKNKNIEKFEFKIPTSEVVQFSNDSDVFFSFFLVATLFWFTFEEKIKKNSSSK